MATIHLATIQDVAREQVLAQVMAQTKGALPKEADVYRLAAPTGRMSRRTIHVHFKMDTNTLCWILWLAFRCGTRGPRCTERRCNRS